MAEVRSKRWTLKLTGSNDPSNCALFFADGADSFLSLDDCSSAGLQGKLLRRGQFSTLSFLPWAWLGQLNENNGLRAYLSSGGLSVGGEAQRRRTPRRQGSRKKTEGRRAPPKRRKRDKPTITATMPLCPSVRDGHGRFGTIIQDLNTCRCHCAARLPTA